MFLFFFFLKHLLFTEIFFTRAEDFCTVLYVSLHIAISYAHGIVRLRVRLLYVYVCVH